MMTVGYDIGSSSIKASLYDVNSGKAVASGTYPKDEMKIDSPKPGWAEQNPETWWDAIKNVTKEILSASRASASDISAIGITYQMHGLVLVDKAKKVLRPSIIWCDSRAVGIGNKAFNEIGKEKCLRLSLNSPGNFTASKLRWVIENEPSTFNKVFKFMLPGDYIALKLTGEITTTAEGLSEGIMWNFESEEPAYYMMEHLGFDKSLMPDIVPVFGHQGTLSKEAAAELGLKAGTPVTYRAGDQPNNALSLNVLQPGEIAATAGTSGVVYGVSDQIKFDKEQRVNTFAHVNHSKNDRRLGILLCINGTGISYSWTRKNILGTGISYVDMDHLADGVSIGSDGIVFLPFGNGAERMLTNLEVGASFSGLNFNVHTRNQIVRSVLEGVAFSFYYGINIMKELAVDSQVIRAGKANMFLNRIFRETISNLTGATIQLYNTDGSLGAARGAAFGAGFYSSLAETFKGLECLATIEPDKRNTEKCKAAYDKWLKTLKSSLSSMA